MPVKKAPQTPAPDALTDEQRDRIRKWHANHKNPAVAAIPLSYKRKEESIASLIDACLNHHGAKGTQFTDWTRACMNWIENHVKFGIRDKQRAKENYRTEHPQYELDSRSHGSNVVPIGDLIREKGK
jgi:hypothetical protein